MTALLALVAQAWACAWFVRALLGSDRDVGSRALRAAITYGLWVGTSSTAAVLALRFAHDRAVVGLAAALAVVAVTMAVTRTKFAGLGCGPSASIGADLRPSRWLWGLAALCATLAFAGCLLTILTRPHGCWDAWCMWIAKASLLHAPGQTWSQFVADLGTYEHPPYPFLIPGFAAQWMDVVGVRSIAPPIVTALGFLVAMGLVTTSALANLRGPRAACFGLLALAGIHQIAQRATDLAADLPLGFYVLAAVALTQVALRRDSPGAMVLAGACLGCATWTKNEGMLALACFVICAPLAASGAGSRQSVRCLALLGLGVAPLLAMTLSFKLAMPALTDLVDAALHRGSLRHLVDADRYLPVAKKLGREVLELGNGLLLVLALTFVVARARADASVRWPAATLVAILFGYALVYITTPLDQAYHLITSSVRLLVHLAPASAFLLVIGLTDALARSRANSA